MILPVARATDRLFIPNVCTARPVLVLVVMAEILAVVLTLSTTTDVNASFDDLALKSLFIQWVTLCCAAVLCASRTLYSRLSEARVAIVAYLSMLAIAWVLSELAWWTLDYLSNPMPLGAPSRGGFLARNLAIAAIVIAIALHYMYVHHHWERRIESESEARLQALQARIRPHFFFNCMNTIASLTRSHPKLAEEAVEDLADLFRASLLPARDRVTLGGELALCRQYLRIEALRLQDRLAIDWQVDDLPADALVPVLSIQPLIENAIYHGIEPLPRRWGDSDQGTARGVPDHGRDRKSQAEGWQAILARKPWLRPGKRGATNAGFLRRVGWADRGGLGRSLPGDIIFPL